MNNINEIEQLFAKDLSSPLFLELAAHYYDKRLYDYAEKVCNIGLNYHVHSIEAQYILAKILLIKGEVNQAEKIGTYKISIEPYQDCCSYFVPINPETKANLDEIIKLDSSINIDEEMQKALTQKEIKTFKFNSDKI